MKIYIAPQSDPRITTLQATTDSWRELLSLRPHTNRLSIGISDDDKLWISAATKITAALDIGEDRVSMTREEASLIVDMSRGLR